MKILAAVLLLASSVTVVSSIYFTECKGLSDIVVAIPGSDIITLKQLEIVEQFFGAFVNYFPLNENDGTRIAFVQYGKNATVTSSLAPFRTQIELETRVSLMAQRQISPEAYIGGYNPAEGIDAIREEISKNKRPGAKTIGLILTIGPAPDHLANDVRTSSQAALAENITMFVVSLLSSGVELPSMTDESCKRFHITDFNGMMITLPYVTTQLCNYLQGIPAMPILCLNPANRLLAIPPTFPFNCPAPNGDFIDPTNCVFYYRCTNGVATRTKCSAGLLFDAKSMTCTQKEFNPCYAPENVCPAGFKGLLPYAGNCAKFINCWNGKGTPQECPPGLYFEEGTQTCNLAINTPCPTEPTKLVPPL